MKTGFVFDWSIVTRRKPHGMLSVVLTRHVQLAFASIVTGRQARVNKKHSCCRDHTMLRCHFAKSLNVIQDHSKSHHSTDRIWIPTVVVPRQLQPYHFREKTRWSKIAIFIPHLHSSAPLWMYPSEYCHKVWYGKKLKRCGYLAVKRFDDMFSRFDTIPACDTQPCDSIIRAM